MHIKDHNDAMKFFRTYDNVASKGKWKEFVDEMEFESMLQEPRTMAQGGGIIGKPGGLVEPGVMYYAKKVKKDTYSTFADMSVEKLKELGFTGKKYRKVGEPGKRYSLMTEEFKTWTKEQTPKAPTWRKGQGVSEEQLKLKSKTGLTKTKVNQILKANSEIKNGLRVFKSALGLQDYNKMPDSVFAKVVKGLGKDKVEIEGLKKVFNQAIKDGSYFTKGDYRKEMIVKTYMDDFAKHGQFTGEAKFNPILKEFKHKIPENAYKEINKTFGEWARGDFEVDGFNRSTLDKHTTKNLTNWKPVKDVSELRLQVDKELRFLNDLNDTKPNLSGDEVKKRFNKKFKNKPYWLETSFENRALQLYPHKVYGEGRFRKVEGVKIGERSSWLKKVYKNNLSGNFSRILVAADSFEEAGNMQMAKKYRKTANELFGSKGIITKVGGQAEHPWFYNYGKGLFQIDSLVKGDLNNFKANNFEIPIRNLINEYDSTTKRPTLARKKAIEAEVKLRRDFLNSITDIGDGGMARNVKFDFTADPGKKITNTTPDIYQLHKTGKLDPLELQTRGTAYRDAVIKNLTEADYNIMKKGTEVMKTQKIGLNKMNKFLSNFWCGSKQIVKKAGGGRIGFSGSCPVEVKQKNFLRMTNDVANGKITGEAAEQIAKNAGKVVAKAGSKSALASIFGPTGILLDVAYEVGSVGTDMAMNNVSFKEAMQNNWITGAFVQGTGQEEYHKGLFAKDSSAEPHGTAIDLIDKIQSEEKNLERIKTNLVRGDYTGEAKKEILAKQEEVIKNLYNDFNKVARKKTTSPGHPEGEQTRYLALEEGSPERIAYDQAKLEYDSGRESKALIKKSSKAGFEQSLESSRAKPWIDFGLLKNPQYGEYSKREIDKRLKQFGDYAGYGWTPYGHDFGMQQMKPGIGDKKYNKDLGYRQVAEAMAESEATDRIAQAGGVANMAEGGIMSLKKKK